MVSGTARRTHTEHKLLFMQPFRHVWPYAVRPCPIVLNIETKTNENSREPQSRENILFNAMINMGAHCDVKVHNTIQYNTIIHDNSTASQLIAELFRTRSIDWYALCLNIYASFQLKRLHFQYIWRPNFGHWALQFSSSITLLVNSNTPYQWNRLTCGTKMQIRKNALLCCGTLGSILLLSLRSNFAFHLVNSLEPHSHTKYNAKININIVCNFSSS